MTPRVLGYAAVAALVLVACAPAEQADTEGEPAEQAEALPPEVARAVAVARGIEAHPGSADSVLSANGLTAAGLDSLMYVIAGDSALSAAYTNALR